EERVGPVGLALVALLLLGGRRLLVGVDRHAFGGSRGFLLRHVGRLLGELLLRLDLRYVYRRGGLFELAMQLLAPGLQFRLPGLEVVEPRMNTLRRLVTRAQEVDDLPVGALQLRGRLAREQVLDPHL